MLFFTGDTHGDVSRFGENGIEGQYTLTEKDYVVVCGDFGFLFFCPDEEGYREQQKELDFLETKPYTILFVDGNHENFALLNGFPVEEWNGGKIHRIRRNVIHLMRGQVYTLEGKTVFTMGGAYSLDRARRQLNRTYWAEELPSNEEYREASNRLAAHGNAVDYVVTHTAPAEIVMRMGIYPDLHDRELTGFFDWIKHDIGFQKWYFGHFHIDAHPEEKFYALLTDCLPG